MAPLSLCHPCDFLLGCEEVFRGSARDARGARESNGEHLLTTITAASVRGRWHRGLVAPAEEGTLSYFPSPRKIMPTPVKPASTATAVKLSAGGATAKTPGAGVAAKAPAAGAAKPAVSPKAVISSAAALKAPLPSPGEPSRPSAAPAKPVAAAGGVSPKPVPSKPGVLKSGAKPATGSAAGKPGTAPAGKPISAADAAKAEAAAKKKAEEEAAAAAVVAAAAAEKARLELEARGTGEITVVYCENRPRVTISKGCCTVEDVDEETALTFVYPKCEIHLTLSKVLGNDWRTVDWSRLEARSKEGVFSGLIAGETYYAVVVEDGEEKLKYEEQQKERAAAFGRKVQTHQLEGEGRQLSLESCSCIEGNPCATPEGCVSVACFARSFLNEWVGRKKGPNKIPHKHFSYPLFPPHTTPFLVGLCVTF